MQHFSLRLSAGLFALFTVNAAAALQAQSSTDLMQYDARGRLVEIQSGRGALSRHKYDSADNRAQAIVQRQLDISWAGTSLYHGTGFAEAFGGWAANVSYAPSYMTYGPYTNSVPSGNRTAVWRIMVDVNTNPASDVVATLDVYDATAGEWLASRNLVRTAFAVPMSYQIFELPFTVDASRAGHLFEFRTYFTAKAYINVERVGYY